MQQKATILGSSIDPSQLTESSTNRYLINNSIELDDATGIKETTS
jgi:hypothetical protein